MVSCSPAPPGAVRHSPLVGFQICPPARRRHWTGSVSHGEIVMSVPAVVGTPLDARHQVLSIRTVPSVSKVHCCAVEPLHSRLRTIVPNAWTLPLRSTQGLPGRAETSG